MDELVQLGNGNSTNSQIQVATTIKNGSMPLIMILYKWPTTILMKEDHTLNF